jgi:Uri superfamily endonuclease
VTLDLCAVDAIAIEIVEHERSNLLAKSKRPITGWKLCSEQRCEKHLWPVFSTTQIAIHNVAAPECTPTNLLRNVFIHVGCCCIGEIHAVCINAHAFGFDVESE